MSCNNNIVAGKVSPEDIRRIREAVCIQTQKIYDTCRDKDCIENAQVIFRYPRRVQYLLRRALGVRVEDAKVKRVFINTEPVPFKDGYYAVDITYVIRVCVKIMLPPSSPGPRCITVPGWVLFNKKVILFGSEGKVKVFSNQGVNNFSSCPGAADQQDNEPTAVVEVANPLPLNAEIVDANKFCFKKNFSIADLPKDLEEEVGENGDDVDEDQNMDAEEFGRGRGPEREVVVTLGLFSIIKLTRLVQLLIPAFDFCVPNKECVAIAGDNACELFDTIDFPVDEFFPKQIHDFSD